MNSRILRFFSFVFLFILFMGCQKKDRTQIQKDPEIKKPETQSVIGGNPISSIGYRSYQVGILTTDVNGNHYQAGGVLISNQWVLTAAHVVTSAIGNNVQLANTSVTVKYGNISLSNCASIGVDQIIRYSGYQHTGQPGEEYDIALLHLSTPISAGGSPVIYATSDDPVAVNDLAIVSGWGIIEDNPGTNSDVGTDLLYAADVTISSITNRLVYTSSSNPQRGPCHGDSGGPLTVSYYDGSTKKDLLVGIVDGWDDPVYGCNSGAKGYARVSYFADWIRDNTSIYNFRLIGPSKICNSDIYKIANLPYGTSVSWSSSDNSIATISGNGASATLTRINGGNVTITAAFNVNGQSNSITKAIEISPDLQNWQPSFTWNECSSNGFSVTITPFPSATRYNWYIDGYLYDVTGPDWNPTSINAGMFNGEQVLTVEAVTPCGITNRPFSIIPCGGQ